MTLLAFALAYVSLACVAYVATVPMNAKNAKTPSRLDRRVSYILRKDYRRCHRS